MSHRLMTQLRNYLKLSFSFYYGVECGVCFRPSLYFLPFQIYFFKGERVKKIKHLNNLYKFFWNFFLGHCPQHTLLLLECSIIIKRSFSTFFTVVAVQQQKRAPYQQLSKRKARANFIFFIQPSSPKHHSSSPVKKKSLLFFFLLTKKYYFFVLCTGTLFFSFCLFFSDAIINELVSPEKRRESSSVYLSLSLNVFVLSLDSSFD